MIKIKILYTTKIAYIIFQALKLIVKSFYDDWHDAKTKEEEEEMLKMAKPAKLISVWCSSLSLTMTTLYLGLRAVTIYLTDKANVNQDRLSLYPGYFPFDVRPAPTLIMVNFAQVIVAYSGAICYTTLDTFITMLIMHICGQFAILRKKLLRLLEGKRESRNTNEFQKELSLIVTRHEKLNG